jgi:hypothetical protein
MFHNQILKNLREQASKRATTTKASQRTKPSEQYRILTKKARVFRINCFQVDKKKKQLNGGSSGIVLIF